MPPKKKPRKGGRKRIQHGTVYGPFTVGDVVRSEVRMVPLRIYTYAVTCRCGRRYEKKTTALTTARVKQTVGCGACGETGKHLAAVRGKLVKSERNAAIVADRAAGVQPSVIAMKYGISRQRVDQIVKRAGATQEER